MILQNTSWQGTYATILRRDPDYVHEAMWDKIEIKNEEI